MGVRTDTLLVARRKPDVGTTRYSGWPYYFLWNVRRPHLEDPHDWIEVVW